MPSKVQSQTWLVLGSVSGGVTQPEFMEQQYPPGTTADDSSS